MLTQEIISIADLSSGQVGEIHQMTTELTVSFTMDLASEISFSVLDPDFRFMAGNYFQVRRDVLYRGKEFEISAIEVGTSSGGSPLITIDARSKQIQLMKRDKTPEGYRGISATDFAASVASRYNLKLFAEQTPTKQTIVKSRGSDSDESVWDVLKRLANEAQFVCFESDGTLFFCSHSFLMNKILIPDGGIFEWPTLNPDAKFLLMDIPNMRRSDDDPLEADGSLILERTNAINLRPGYTAELKGVPTFNGQYLITEVRFTEVSPEPIEVSIRTPEKPKPEKKSGGSGGRTRGSGNQSTTTPDGFQRAEEERFDRLRPQSPDAETRRFDRLRPT